MDQHAVHRLYQKRLAQATRPFNARGGSVKRCQACLLPEPQCTCSERPVLKTDAAFLLCMYDDEVLKPSNTGRLIADLVPDTHAWIWSRTGDNSEMKALIANPDYQPYLVFPASYAEPERQVVNIPDTAKTPLFILLDGSWREARRMFRKSPWMAHLPMLSIDPEILSRYQIRKSANANQLATAEVAARLLEVMGEPDNAALLDCWFDLFTERYQLGAHQYHNGRTERELLETQPALTALKAQLAQVSEKTNCRELS